MSFCPINIQKRKIYINIRCYINTKIIRNNIGCPKNTSILTNEHQFQSLLNLVSVKNTSQNSTLKCSLFSADTHVLRSSHYKMGIYAMCIDVKSFVFRNIRTYLTLKKRRIIHAFSIIHAFILLFFKHYTNKNSTNQ